MNYESILFNDEMVRAIPDGRKTQHRLPVKHQGRPLGEFAFYEVDGNEIRTESGHTKRCPFGGPGDRLWVRECWQQTELGHRIDGRWVVESRIIPKPSPGIGYLHYRADREQDPPPRWRASTHMPRWASRTTLEVLRVWVERVQDISPRDAWAEGARCSCTMPVPMCKGNVEAFGILWDSIYGTWDANPWVWCCEFRQLKG